MGETILSTFFERFHFNINGEPTHFLKSEILGKLRDNFKLPKMDWSVATKTEAGTRPASG